jgi:hypothetical protein
MFQRFSQRGAWLHSIAKEGARNITRSHDLPTGVPERAGVERFIRLVGQNGSGVQETFD